MVLYIFADGEFTLRFSFVCFFPIQQGVYINISHIFLGETPFHPRRSGGTQEENGDWGGSKEEGRSLSTLLGLLVRVGRKALQ